MCSIRRIHPSEGVPDIFICPPAKHTEKISGGHRTTVDEVFVYVFYTANLIFVIFIYL